MSMKWVLYDFKTAKEDWYERLCEVYCKKIKPFVHFEIQHLKTIKADRHESELKKNFEEKVLLEKISKDDFIILFDEKAKKFDSLSFAKLVEKTQSSGKKRGVLIVGGAYGVSDNFKKKAQATVCLSDLTMNHLVAEAVALEQFYRAQTIINRIPYHNI